MCRIFAGQNPADYEPETRRLRLNGHSTSIRLERSFWRIIDGIAESEGVSTPAFVSKLHAEVLEDRGEARNFTSLLRCACLIRTKADLEPGLTEPGKPRVAAQGPALRAV